MAAVWKIEEQFGALNAANAAEASESLVENTRSAPYFNFLIVQNFDPAVDAQILLDSGVGSVAVTNAAATGKLFRVAFNGGTLVIEPEDGIHFKQVVLRNPHGTTAQTVSTISVQWGFKRRIG